MNLDQQQQAAVKTASHRALVIAGAGSGKTRVLISRIAHLLKNCRVSGYEVLAMTFTRKAAGEMRERLESAVGLGAHRVIMGTMHALALRMVRKFGEVIGLKPDNITVYSEWEEAFLLKEVAIEMGTFKKSWKLPKKDIKAVFSDYYERGREPDKDSPVYSLFKAFLARCRENNALTFGMLLHALERLIPIMARHLHIRHILVDEVQDIDPLQWRIINGMCEAFGASLFACGDVDQSIFSFRGAVPGHLVEHQSDFDVFLLESNYRSVPAIVEGANRLIAHNSERIGKTMRATREDGLSRLIIQEDADSTFIAELMNDYHSLAPESLNGTAILARTHILLKRLDQELTVREIPHTYVGRKTALTNSEEFRRFHAFLKLIENPYDNFSFLLIRDLMELSLREYADVRVLAAQEGLSHFQAWYFNAHGQHLYADHFFHPIFSVKSLVSAMFLLQYAATEAVPFGPPGWGFDVYEIVQFVMTWLADHLNGTIAEYLDWLATWDTTDEIKDEPEGVTLSTIHTAKGLEWPIVIVAGCNEGLLPSKQAIAAGEIEEERRLMYVAMTRARDQLVLAVRPEHKEAADGQVYENPVSRFVEEATQ